MCRSDTKPDNLDVGNSRLWNQIKTEFLINNWDPGTLWTDFGVHTDIVVRFLHCTLLNLSEFQTTAFYIWFPSCWYSRVTVTGPPPSGDQRNVQGPYCYVGERILAGSARRDSGTQNYCRYWSLVCFFLPCVQNLCEVTLFISISAIPAFPGLRHFPNGHNFTQWTGDNSKALMKVSFTFHH